jgi:hypothetical protein
VYENLSMLVAELLRSLETIVERISNNYNLNVLFAPRPKDNYWLYLTAFILMFGADVGIKMVPLILSISHT